MTNEQNPPTSPSKEANKTQLELHDKTNGRRYGEPIQAFFQGAAVKTGRG